MKKKPLLVILVACILVLYILKERKNTLAVYPAEGATNLVTFCRTGARISAVRRFTYNGKVYVEVIGEPRMSLLSLPSGPPVYIFDDIGTFVDWSSDIGDNQTFIRKWGGFSNSCAIGVDDS